MRSEDMTSDKKRKRRRPHPAPAFLALPMKARQGKTFSLTPISSIVPQSVKRSTRRIPMQFALPLYASGVRPLRQGVVKPQSSRTMTLSLRKGNRVAIFHCISISQRCKILGKVLKSTLAGAILKRGTSKGINPPIG
jgi:hypothetical protein